MSTRSDFPACESFAAPIRIPSRLLRERKQQFLHFELEFASDEQAGTPASALFQGSMSLLNWNGRFDSGTAELPVALSNWCQDLGYFHVSGRITLILSGAGASAAP
jgi:hypothetical protein